MAPEIEPSCIKIEVKNEVYLEHAKNKGAGEIAPCSLGPTGGKPPDHLAKAKWAQ